MTSLKQIFQVPTFKINYIYSILKLLKKLSINKCYTLNKLLKNNKYIDTR